MALGDLPPRYQKLRGNIEACPSPKVRPLAQKVARAPVRHCTSLGAPCCRHHALADHWAAMVQRAAMKCQLRIGAHDRHGTSPSPYPATPSPARFAFRPPITSLRPSPPALPSFSSSPHRLRCVSPRSSDGRQQIRPKYGVSSPNVRGGRVYQTHCFMCILVYPTLAFPAFFRGGRVYHFSGVGYTYLAAGCWLLAASCWLVAAGGCLVAAGC